MLVALLRQTELGDLLGLVSPSLFDVVSVPRVLRRGRQVMKESGPSWEARRARIAAGLPPGVRLVQSLDGAPLRGGAPVDEAARAAIGEGILTVYFAQLFWDLPTALDLRAPAWAWSPENLQWRPSSTTVVWDPGFIASMRGVYGGFYGGDPAAFEAALDGLDLRGAADLFRAHFGTGDQRAVVFDRRAFVQSFGAIFEHCKRSGVTIHEDFVLLGAYLAGLYDTLSDLGVALDVRAAYEAARAHVASR
jgi:hypothetical protein